MAIHAIATYGDNLSPTKVSVGNSFAVGYNALTYPSRHPEQTQEAAEGTIENVR